MHVGMHMLHDVSRLLLICHGVVLRDRHRLQHGNDLKCAFVHLRLTVFESPSLLACGGYSLIKRATSRSTCFNTISYVNTSSDNQVDLFNMRTFQMKSEDA